MKDIIIGLFAFLGLILVSMVFIVILLALTYYIGYVVGLALGYIIGIKVIAGIVFPKFIGVFLVVGNMIAMLNFAYNGAQKGNKKIYEELKKYRGY